MVVITACQCDHGLGLPHSHIEAQVTCRRSNDFDVVGKTFTVPLSVYEMNRSTLVEISRTESSISVWINWRDVARVLLVDGG